MNSIKTLLMVAVATLPFIACSQNTPVLKPQTEVAVQQDSTLQANAVVVIPGLSIQVYLPSPAWRSVASGHNFGTNSNNVTAITVPKGVQIRMVLNDNSKPIAATWISSDPTLNYVWPTTGIEGRLAPIYAGYTSTITAKTADGRSKSFTVYSAGMTADPAPTIGAGARNIFVVRPDHKIVVSGALLGAGIPNATGYTYETAIVPNNTGYVPTSCEPGADFVVCRTTNPKVVLVAGIDTNMLGQNLEALTPYELPGTLMDVAAHFYTTVITALVNGNILLYSGGMNANGQLANGQPRTTSGRTPLSFTGGGGLIKLNSSEKISLGYFWNGEAWVSGEYGGFALRDGGAGNSAGWDRANYLDHWLSVTHDENLFCGLGALRTHVLMFGKATGWECGYPGDHFPPRFLAIPNGEIGVRIAKGRGFAVLMTEQNVYYAGLLQLNGAPQCYGWCKVPVPGVPLEIDAKGFTNIIKTTTGVYTIRLGTLQTLNLYPEAVGVSFEINPTSVSQLVHSTTRIKVSTVGFGANDFTATSSHPDVTLEQIFFEGKALLVHCLRPVSSTVTVTLTHNVLPTVKKTFPVTCKDDQAPTAELSVPSTVLPFKDAAFNWKYGDADSSVETARIEVDGNLIWDVYGTPEGSRNHQFSTAATGTHSVCLVVISRGLTTRSCKSIQVTGNTTTGQPPTTPPNPTTPPTPSKGIPAASAILFIHGYQPPAGEKDCGKYWKGLPSVFASWGYAKSIRNIGYYTNGINCDNYLRLSGGSIDRNTDIQTLGNLFSWYIYDNFTKKGLSVSIVAHSMGGLISRMAIAGTATKQGGFPPTPLLIKSLITLGTPNSGFKYSGLKIADVDCQVLAPGGYQCKQMTIGSDFLKFINSIDWYTSGIENRLHIGSYFDEVVSGDSAISSVYGVKAVYEEIPAYNHGGYMSDFSVANDASCYELIPGVSNSFKPTCKRAARWAFEVATKP